MRLLADLADPFPGRFARTVEISAICMLAVGAQARSSTEGALAILPQDLEAAILLNVKPRGEVQLLALPIKPAAAVEPRSYGFPYYV
jgi:hypothetical protein